MSFGGIMRSAFGNEPEVEADFLIFERWNLVARLNSNLDFQVILQFFYIAIWL